MNKKIIINKQNKKKKNKKNKKIAYTGCMEHSYDRQ